MSSAKLRVLIIPASYFARNRTVGGGERYALEYARALADLAPTTLGLFDLQPKVEHANHLEIRTFTVRHFDQRRGFPMTAESWRALNNYDVLHIMDFPTPLADLLLISAWLRRQTVVLTDVGGGCPCWSTYLERLYWRANLNRLADGLAPLSQHASRLFADWPQPKVILYGGVNLRELVHDHREPGGFALFVGRLLPHKGVLPLIQAVNPETPLHVVGRPYDVPYFRQLQQAAAGKKVTFFLDADDAELKHQYAHASVVLQPSVPTDEPAKDKSELLGLVALEGMASGKPVIVTRTASLPELVVDGENGFIVNPYDLPALRDRIDLLVQNPQVSRTIGEAARKHVAAHFTWEKTAERGLSFYQTFR
jgi:glycosyltransferase involved in cell wall biosynthesis